MPGESEQQQDEDQLQLDPHVVIDSLQAQLAAKSLDLAKSQAINALLQGEIANLRQAVDNMRQSIKTRGRVPGPNPKESKERSAAAEQAAVEHHGRTTKRKGSTGGKN